VVDRLPQKLDSFGRRPDEGTAFCLVHATHSRRTPRGTSVMTHTRLLRPSACGGANTIDSLFFATMCNASRPFQQCTHEMNFLSSCGRHNTSLLMTGRGPELSVGRGIVKVFCLAHAKRWRGIATSQRPCSRSRFETAKNAHSLLHHKIIMRTIERHMHTLLVKPSSTSYSTGGLRGAIGVVFNSQCPPKLPAGGDLGAGRGRGQCHKSDGRLHGCTSFQTH
jgi:hypothetical protein